PTQFNPKTERKNKGGFCEHCGAPLVVTDSFCPMCGTTVGSI
ncbi:MAG: zinc-ribbon domain-containing protein, partial [Candidatus Hodarchaeales archaeon]